MRLSLGQRFMSLQKPSDIFYFPVEADFQPSFLFMNHSGTQVTLIKSSDINELKDVTIANTIESASEKIAYTISHPKTNPLFSSALLIPIITGLVGASAAFIYNKIHWYSVRKRDEKLKKVDALIEIVISLEEVSVDYWMKNYAKKLSKDNKKAEIKIKSCLSLINTLIQDIIDKEPKRKREILSKQFMEPHDELYDLITGDDFESTSRKSNPSKSDQISSKCLKYRVALTTGL